MKLSKIVMLIVLGMAVIGHARAQDGAAESWTVEGKTFGDKASAIRYIVSIGKRVNVEHKRCEILTNKLTFKACPKNKATAFENEQFETLRVSK